MRNALEDLIAARPAFGGTTEAKRLAEITHLHLREGRVDWLEIGAGDGRNLRYLLRQLAIGRSFRVVALEPATDGMKVKSVEWRRQRAEDYDPDRTFDWMNMRHSAYYLVDAVTQITRLAHALDDGGAIALTHWSRDCILHRLHVAICGAARELATSGIEDIALCLVEKAGLIVSKIEHVATKLNVDLVQRDKSVAGALYEIARRERDPIAPAEPDKAEYLRGLLSGMDDRASRLNGVAIIRRPR